MIVVCLTTVSGDYGGDDDDVWPDVFVYVGGLNMLGNVVLRKGLASMHFAPACGIFYR